MAIVWNKVTWYSKLLAALFFIFVLPVITFYVGREYQNTKATLKQYETVETPLEQDSIRPLSAEQSAEANVTSSVPSSGIYGRAMLGNKVFVGHIAIQDSRGKIITTTKTRSDGHFFLLLPPGPYKISALPTHSNPKPTATAISVEKNSVSKTTINL